MIIVIAAMHSFRRHDSSVNCPPMLVVVACKGDFVGILFHVVLVLPPCLAWKGWRQSGTVTLFVRGGGHHGTAEETCHESCNGNEILN